MNQAVPKSLPAPLAPGQWVSGYRIVQKIGAGGFGIVYRAVSPTGQEVALKEYLPAALATRAHGEAPVLVEKSKRSLYRIGFRSFLDEGRALAQIVHPNVVSVLNFFQENDTVYLVMDYLQGSSLQQFIVTSASLNHVKVFRESTIRSLFDEVLRGLRVVHQHQMLHLDIKPGNILVTDDDRAVLIDFGAARDVLRTGGKFLQPMFTPGFSAPEMYKRGKPVGPWTDIYAIGACIFSCMQGCPPPDASKSDCRATLEVLVSELRGKYSSSLIELVLACMQADPQSRPHSVLAVQKILSSPPPNPADGVRPAAKLSSEAH
ncbi:MAG: serine/threonine-protein kinase [Rhodoferax sp.]|nr:serine/threonine-protein kinase [Rhodoferax sp.]